ncbi:PcfB family protein [Brevibacillus ruminantium]|uniref:PcfB family protein n=1 Tax=Brevibacillus ruminantium TaxID=2950604 RepID=A0ABY4WH71_9BACL|nr:MULTISPECIES: PcfB family protein [Brevibacillus]MCC0565584.1 PcfB family protein [Brevibacillus borstelensis]MED1872819.1 PcfB family protein [Brevibacillus borstelensis]USG66495.1 PcfB family protein [Brevibacillus ruminantium]
MSSGAEAADQVVNMSLRGIEVMAKISGEGAKHLAVYLFAALQGQKRTKGSIRLESLLRSGKELKVFAVKNEDLPTFCKEAKRYGVLYCALRDKKNVDGLCDVMVRAEDASKINRIVERFKLATVDTASIKSEIEKSRAGNQHDQSTSGQHRQQAPDQTRQQMEEQRAAVKGTSAEKSTNDVLDELMQMPESAQPTSPANGNPNPAMATTEPPHPSEPTLGRSEASARGMIEPKAEKVQQRPSIRELLREIREENRKAEKERRQMVKESSLPKRSERNNGKVKTGKTKPIGTRKRGKAK